jgi:hypothetical protein
MESGAGEGGRHRLGKRLRDGDEKAEWMTQNGALGKGQRLLQVHFCEVEQRACQPTVTAP